MKNEILLEECYDEKHNYLGKITVSPEDLKELELKGDSILDNINNSDSMGYKKYKNKILKQKEYILRIPKKVV